MAMVLGASGEMSNTCTPRGVHKLSSGSCSGSGPSIGILSPVRSSCVRSCSICSMIQAFIWASLMRVCTMILHGSKRQRKLPSVIETKYTPHRFYYLKIKPVIFQAHGCLNKKGLCLQHVTSQRKVLVFTKLFASF